MSLPGTDDEPDTGGAEGDRAETDGEPPLENTTGWSIYRRTPQGTDVFPGRRLLAMTCEPWPVS